jgi:hypothetical protein
LFDEQLEMAVSSGDLHPFVIEWVSEDYTGELQDRFLPDLPDAEAGLEGGGGGGGGSSAAGAGGPESASFCGGAVKAKLWMNLDGDVAPLYLNVLPIVASADPRRRESLLYLCPLVRFLAACEMATTDGKVEEMDALLGCPVMLFDEAVLDDAPTMDAEQRRVVAQSLFHAVNWFRELLNAFSLQESFDLRCKTRQRLRGLIQLERHLELFLDNCSGGSGNAHLEIKFPVVRGTCVAMDGAGLHGADSSRAIESEEEDEEEDQPAEASEEEDEEEDVDENDSSDSEDENDGDSNGKDKKAKDKAKAKAKAAKVKAAKAKAAKVKAAKAKAAKGKGKGKGKGPRVPKAKEKISGSGWQERLCRELSHPVVHILAFQEYKQVDSDSHTIDPSWQGPAASQARRSLTNGVFPLTEMHVLLVLLESTLTRACAGSGRRAPGFGGGFPGAKVAPGCDGGRQQELGCSLVRSLTTELFPALCRHVKSIATVLRKEEDDLDDSEDDGSDGEDVYRDLEKGGLYRLAVACMRRVLGCFHLVVACDELLATPRGLQDVLAALRPFAAVSEDGAAEQQSEEAVLGDKAVCTRAFDFLEDLLGVMPTLDAALPWVNLLEAVHKLSQRVDTGDRGGDGDDNDGDHDNGGGFGGGSGGRGGAAAAEEPLSCKLSRVADKLMQVDWAATTRLPPAQKFRYSSAQIQRLVTLHLTYAPQATGGGGGGGGGGSGGSNSGALQALERYSDEVLLEAAVLVKDETSETYPTLCRATIASFYRPCLEHTVDMLQRFDHKAAIASGKATSAGHIEFILKLVKVFKTLVHRTKEAAFGATLILTTVIKSGRAFVVAFSKHAFPYLEKVFKKNAEPVLQLLKQFSSMTRQLQHVCNHSKVRRARASQHSSPLYTRAALRPRRGSCWRAVRRFCCLNRRPCVCIDLKLCLCCPSTLPPLLWRVVHVDVRFRFRFRSRSRSHFRYCYPSPHLPPPPPSLASPPNPPGDEELGHVPPDPVPEARHGANGLSRQAADGEPRRC